jgi:hypothetical protein
MGCLLLSVAVGSSQRVHVRDRERRALHGNQRIVDLRTVRRVEGVDLPAVRRVHLVEVLYPADAGKASVVVGVKIRVWIRHSDSA